MITKNLRKGKKDFIIATMGLFSGDGAGLVYIAIPLLILALILLPRKAENTFS